MIPIVWDMDARKIYDGLVDKNPKSKTALPLYQREQLNQRINALREWPPTKWFDLRNQSDGAITFQLDTDQFLEIHGLFENGIVKITHLVYRKRKN